MEIKSELIPETTVVVPSKISLTLVMSQAEAQALRDICGHVGGSFNGPRGVMAKIGRALEDCGIFFKNTKKDDEYVYDGTVSCPSKLPVV